MKKVMRSKKGRVLIILGCVFLMLFIISEIFVTSITENIVKANTIRIAVDPFIPSTLYYFEVKPNKELVSCMVQRSGYGYYDKIPAKFSKIKIIEKQTIKLTNDEYNEIKKLANGSIKYGYIDESITLNGNVNCEFYYRGVYQRIYHSDEDYEDLYKLLLKVTDAAPTQTSIDLRTIIIDNYD